MCNMQIAQKLGQDRSSRDLGAQDAAMLVWALAVLHALHPSMWNALLDLIAAAPEDALDEVTLT